MDQDALDQSIDRLQSQKDEWATLDIDRRIQLLEGFIDRTVAVADRQVAEALDQKEVPADSPHAAEEWFAGPIAQIRTARMLLDSLEAIRQTGSPAIDESRTRRRESGGLAVEVFPDSLWDKLSYQGFSAEVWMQSEVDQGNLDEHVAEFYRQSDPEGAVNLVLGAGNVASIPPLDALYKLFVEGQVPLVKMNPVNDYLGDFIEEVFEEFIDAGYVDVVYGGVEVGDYLCQHDEIDEIHITGSDRTHDAIVYGTGEEGEERRKEDDRRVDKRITSELGNVSPVIVVPGPWSQEDLEFHAENVATQLANNAGFNCNAVRVMVLPESWDRTDAFIEAVESAFRDVEPRHAYYPGAHDRYERFTELEEDTVTVGEAEDGELPFAIIRDVDHEEEDHPAFNEEAWCTVTSTTRLPGDSPADFLENAVDFCNETVWGTLNAAILIHPESRRQIEEPLEEALEELRYGTIALNHWPAIGYALGVTPWGAHPGHTYQDIQSGIGVVHNTMMFDKPEKTILDGPFRVSPKPPWFVTNPAGIDVARKLVDFEHDPSVGGFLSVAWSTLFGG
jgi:acyl-CoA reductase-like NAD-dependent aldehyde dehydrogenase